MFADFDLPLSDQERLFEALGASSEYDSLSIEEFVKGCQIMSSPAKTYDLKFMEVANAKTVKKMEDWRLQEAGLGEGGFGFG